jgi:hypothetical protein
MMSGLSRETLAESLIRPNWKDMSLSMIKAKKNVYCTFFCPDHPLVRVFIRREFITHESITYYLNVYNTGDNFTVASFKNHYSI